ncbi:MAG: hypothetical protein EBU57_05585 [Alphaproteobacteria bacterium]|jgi:hypothetical protein|nr:hypothetical protein [Alphaproteobacteria bacterium]
MKSRYLHDIPEPDSETTGIERAPPMGELLLCPPKKSARAVAAGAGRADIVRDRTRTHAIINRARNSVRPPDSPGEVAG